MSAAGRTLDLLRSFDRLFEGVVMSAGEWDERAFSDWLEAAIGDGESLDRQAAKIVTRAVRRAQRLQRYWAIRTDGPEDWRMRVDETLGSAGWRPGLELAEWGMAVDPDPELFEEYSERFRAVNFTPVALAFEEWLENR
ncbi:MAG: hypothetical protein HKO63_04765 [Acidimicrobiia bacterium]|nr:hypothetical protein [Acidimicrobiia bacterium]MBT8192691.1 hypothetical protein [Acidimicrobiia bacterium]NNF88765.1 hypothetical protein [Acidimicrobiia bacterium]NNL13231.1 hypothetical protein [Acidimicrobiia bacterium]NNL97498.1 hypothetical protein [Acidimicrobiia bacterium]